MPSSTGQGNHVSSLSTRTTNSRCFRGRDSTATSSRAILTVSLLAAESEYIIAATWFISLSVSNRCPPPPQCSQWSLWSVVGRGISPRQQFQLRNLWQPSPSNHGRLSLYRCGGMGFRAWELIINYQTTTPLLQARGHGHFIVTLFTALQDP